MQTCEIVKYSNRVIFIEMFEEKAHAKLASVMPLLCQNSNGKRKSNIIDLNQEIQCISVSSMPNTVKREEKMKGPFQHLQIIQILLSFEKQVHQ